MRASLERDRAEELRRLTEVAREVAGRAMRLHHRRRSCLALPVARVDEAEPELARPIPEASDVEPRRGDLERRIEPDDQMQMEDAARLELPDAHEGRQSVGAELAPRCLVRP